jgi:hypothetical protein
VTLAVGSYLGETNGSATYRARNRPIADRLDRGSALHCRITAIDPEEGAYEAIEVRVALPFEDVVEEQPPRQT